VDTFQYRIQPNDILSVRFQSLTSEEFDVFNRETTVQMNGNLQTGSLMMGELVDEFGQIDLPAIGRVTVQGLTVFAAQDTLQRLANKFVEDPVVKVRLLNYRITILGEVNREGSITLSNNRVSMLEALGLAGGIGELGDRSKIKLIRQREGNTEIQYIDLQSESFLNSPYYYVYQNDVLIVPPLKQRPFRRYFGQNMSLFVSTVSVILLTINLIRN
jgi:polysaccharide export outer membrane protein